MPSQQQIQNTILSAAYKNAVAVHNNYNLINRGGQPRNEPQINYIWLNIDGLQYLFNFGDYVSPTCVTLYDRLNDFIGFDTNINSLDPHAQIPGTVIQIVNPSNYIAPQPYIPWSDFDPATQQPDGGRYIYYNSTWKGYNPVLSLISPAETALVLGTDYELVPSGGIQLLPTSAVLPFIYNGEAVRSVAYVLA